MSFHLFVNFLMQKPPSGPITMAAISIVMDVSLIIAPMTAMAPKIGRAHV